jgi:SH3-like domain-containing protein
VESSPDESGTDLFLIHEGTKVNVKESVGEWTRIKLSDGKEGWVPTSSIVEI